MKRIQGYLVCMFMLSLIVIPCRAFAFLGLEAGVGYWKQSPSGTIGYKPVGTTVGDIDLKDDLNFKDESNPFVRIKAELPLILPNVYLMATPMSFEGSGTIARSISFGGQPFLANSSVKSKLKLDHYDVALFYPVPLLKTATMGVLNIELGLNARKIDFEGTIADGTTTSSKSLSLYMPMIYAGIQVKPISLIAVELEGRFISMGKNHYNDYIAKIKVMPIGPLYFAGGFRTEDIKIDASDVKASIKFSGPFAEAGLSF